jgi:hypothetical protein
MSVANPSVPAVVSTGLICLVLGAGAGVVATQMYGPFLAGEKKSPNSPEDMVAQGGGMPLPGPPMAAGAGGGEGKGKGKGKGGPPGGMGGGRQLSARTQLARLVAKLDQLTGKSLTITLTDDQKAKLAEQLAGLEAAEELKDDEAKKRMNAILEIFRDNRSTMEAAGYSWPDSPPLSRPQQEVPNPFTSAENGLPLKALQERAGKAKS